MKRGIIHEEWLPLLSLHGLEHVTVFLSSVNQKYSYLVHRDDVRFKLDY